MNRADRRAAAHQRVGRGRLAPVRQLTREEANEVRLELLYSPQTKRLHAGLAKGPGPGRPFCERYPSLFQHPLFTRDPNFGPSVPTERRHQYALAALQLNDGCADCIAAMLKVGEAERIDPEYPFLDPVKAEG